MKNGQPETDLGKAATRLLEHRRKEAMAMLVSCGVDLRDIPFDAHMEREGDEVSLYRFVRHPVTGQTLLNASLTDLRLERFSVTPESIPSWIPFA